jgi:hypothetical protein
MKRSSAPRKTANLSPSLNQRLSAYALAAGAAGVSALALAQPAEAKIVYTHADQVLRFRGPGVDIDLNHDGINDFKLQSIWVYANTRGMLALSLGSNRVFGKVSAGYPASRLRAGCRIGPQQDKFQKGGFFESLSHSRRVGPAKALYISRVSESSRGWLTGEHGYLGLQFLIKGKTHYGWARIVHDQATSWRLTGYAYETVPNRPIIAGATKGGVEESQPADVSFKTNAPKPATIGMLALGAPGLSIWKRDDGAAAPECN